jgi:hypothetical protein
MAHGSRDPFLQNAISIMIYFSAVVPNDQPKEPSSRCCHFRNRVVAITVIST